VRHSQQAGTNQTEDDQHPKQAGNAVIFHEYLMLDESPDSTPLAGFPADLFSATGNHCLQPHPIYNFLKSVRTLLA
jgi:hypothetical protein